MSPDFNPYREWLGVTSTGSSPSYYELLGLRPLEADVGKINPAYQRQSSQLAAHLSGGQAALAQRLMSELAEARMTLMTPTAKRAYDQALAARSPAAPASETRQAGLPSASDVQDILPPAASGHGAGPTAVVLPNAPVYAAPQAYPAPQLQAGFGHPASPVVPNYYVPQAVASAPVVPLEPQPTEAMPTIRRRLARRRSSPVPALIGTTVIVAGVLGGLWFYLNGHETVVTIAAGDGQPHPSDSPSQVAPSSRPQPERKTIGTGNDRTAPAARAQTAADDEMTKPREHPALAPNLKDDRPAPRPMPAEMDGDMPRTDKPAEQATMPAPEESSSEKPKPDKPNPQPKPREAGPEEAAAVAETLKNVRAALASRDLPKAKDLLDEATIEATAPDTQAQVNRVETLTNYVEMFWEAARKTLPKLQAAETIEIDGKMVAIVEADEEHLVVRIDGRNREYAWTKIPSKIAYYLADRWLAPDDPVRNLVLAAFQIVEPKGDLAQAKSLLDAAAAARLKVEPLYAELKAARGG